jgi:hypothetical protein
MGDGTIGACNTFCEEKCHKVTSLGRFLADWMEPSGYTEGKYTMTEPGELSEQGS